MKKRVFKSFLFVFAVSALITLFVFSGSAKTVNKNGFSFDVGEKSVAVVSYTGKAKKVRIPAKVDSLPVTKINNECFWQVRTMTSLSIPDSVTEIGESAFNECTGLKKLVLPGELRKIGNSAFWYCTNLRTVVLDSKVSRIGKDAFRGCEKVTVYVVAGTRAEKHLKKLGTVKYAYTYPTALSAPKKLKLYIGNTKALNVTQTPADTYYKALEYTSSSNAASVSSDGVVTASGCGTATLTATVKGMESVSAQTKLTVIPRKPGSLSQSASGQTSVTLKWKKSAGATGYRVSRYDSAKKKWTTLTETDKTSFTVKGLGRGESVTLRVRSFYKAGKSLILGGYRTITAQTKSVAAVSGLKKTACTVDSITVSWNRLSSAAKYRVVLCNASGKALNGNITTDRTSCTLSVPSYNDTYKIRVCGIFKSGSGSYDGKYAEITAKALSPEKITGLKAASVTATGVSLSWNRLSGADRYYIYKYDEAKKAYSLCANTQNNTAAISALSPETEYRFLVSPVYKKTDGELFAAPGAAVTVKTPAQFTVPKTKDEALKAFAKAFNNTAGQKNFLLFESRTVSDRRVAPDEEKFSNLLSAVDMSGKTDYNFVSGTETSKKLPLEKLLPFFNGRLSFSAEDAESLNVSVSEDGSGYVIELSAAKLKKGSSLPGSLSALPDWETLEKAQGISLESVEYENLFVSAKVNEGRLDTLSASVSFTAKGTKEKSAFEIGEKIHSEYIFLWN